MNRERWVSGGVGAAAGFILAALLCLAVHHGGGGPVPPAPNPPPTPAPIPAEGLRVLIVYETADVSAYPAAQAAILTAQPIRDYLNAKCVKVNGTPEYRILDQNADMGNESLLWQAAMKLNRPSLPWIVISNGRVGHSGPLPKNVQDTLDMLKKYGG